MSKYVKRLRWYLSREVLRERLWEPIRRRLHRVRQLRIERDYWKAAVDDGAGYHEALGRVKNELGVPSDDTPAPVANAWYIADAALNGHRFDFGDEEHASNVVAVANEGAA